MIDKHIITPPSNYHGEPIGCVLVLPGRGIPGTLMEKFMFHTGLWRSLQVVLEPHNLEWYPAPNGPEDQEAAIWGLSHARKILEYEIERIEKGWGFKKKDMIILGFSAGAVMAIQMLAHSDKPYAGILSLAGAILDPADLPKAKYKTPVLLQHNMDDDCFKWDERYLPMLKSLTKKGYNVTTNERPEGGHTLTGYDVDLTREFVSKQFGYWEDYEVIEEETKPSQDDDDDDDFDDKDIRE